MTQTYRQYGQQPFSYCNGFQISNGVYPDTTYLNISPGITIDSTNTFQLVSNNQITINNDVVGLNGLDTGTFTANTMYCVYLVWDAVTSLPAGAVVSLSYIEPMMPLGYNAFKLIGYVAVDSALNFYEAEWTAGNTGFRYCYYNAGATLLLNGTSTSPALVSAASWLPNVPLTNAVFTTRYTSSTVGNQGSITAGNTKFSYQSAAAVASIPVENQWQIPVGLGGSLLNPYPVVEYQVMDSGADTYTINLNGYYFTI